MRVEIAVGGILGEGVSPLRSAADDSPPLFPFPSHHHHDGSGSSARRPLLIQLTAVKALQLNTSAVGLFRYPAIAVVIKRAADRLAHWTRETLPQLLKPSRSVLF